MFYSKTTGGFYDKEIHGSAIPGDAVEITSEYHAELMAGQSAGQWIQPDNKGFPRLTDPPKPTPEQEQAQRNMQSRAYLASTDWYVIRQTETGEAVPEEVLAKRAEARASIVE